MVTLNPDILEAFRNTLIPYFANASSSDIHWHFDYSLFSAMQAPDARQRRDVAELLDLEMTLDRSANPSTSQQSHPVLTRIPIITAQLLLWYRSTVGTLGDVVTCHWLNLAVGKEAASSGEQMLMHFSSSPCADSGTVSMVAFRLASF